MFVSHRTACAFAVWLFVSRFFFRTLNIDCTMRDACSLSDWFIYKLLKGISPCHFPSSAQVYFFFGLWLWYRENCDYLHVHLQSESAWAVLGGSVLSTGVMAQATQLLSLRKKIWKPWRLVVNCSWVSPIPNTCRCYLNMIYCSVYNSWINYETILNQIWIYAETIMN